ncbi:MAG: AAA family ATPase [Candidatus Gracilibacteria bacterium]|nr:AAA family ATPase [Candidatus Gracilibacteria bacterium]MDD2908651.1 AAA family ATPase [Candidatus Gracilibacteria bacterium]
MKTFFEIQKNLLDNNFTNVRDIFSEIDFEQRLVGIIGPRGVGKTTILIKYLGLNNLSNSLYISADNIYFLENKLFDFAIKFKNEYDGKILIIDEIHKYKNWQQELKNIYDSFPEIKIVFSGSSSIDLKSGNYDLSRRAKLYYVNGFSFREFINYKYNQNLRKYQLNEILNNHLEISQKLPNIPIIKYFKEYLESGYYPYYVNEKQKDNLKIIETINKTIYDDIANYYNVKTENLIYFKKILNYLSIISPGEINSNKISKTLEIDNKTVNTYLEILEKGGLIRFLLKDTNGYNVMKNTSKIYIDNTNLIYAINANLLQEIKIGLIRETFFINSIQNSKNSIVHSKMGDFKIYDDIFEIGGKNKTFKQIKDIRTNSFLVLDDIIVGEKNIIPLYLFGLLN